MSSQDSGSLRRSLSMPHLDSRHDSGVGYSGSGSCNGIDQAEVYAHIHNPHHDVHPELLIPLGGGLAAELKQLMTMRQHYYPEGNWGWIVLIAGFFVQILTHGLQLSYAVQLEDVGWRFRRRPYESGKLI